MTATLNLILETLDNQKVVARSTEFPDCVAIADSREEAIAVMQQQLAERLKTIEFVSLSFPTANSPTSDELADSFGVFKDDPYFAEILQAMRDERELDTDNPAYT
jgi:predicted RNase H-like HicB family nuclease